MFNQITSWLHRKDDHIELLEARCYDLNSELDRLRSSVLKHEAVFEARNNLANAAIIELTRDVKWLKLQLELVRSKVKGITDDRNDLQKEHNCLIEAFDKLVADNTSKLRDIESLKENLSNCNNRMEKYHSRSIRQGIKLRDVQRAIRGSIR